MTKTTKTKRLVVGIIALIVVLGAVLYSFGVVAADESTGIISADTGADTVYTSGADGEIDSNVIDGVDKLAIGDLKANITITGNTVNLSVTTSSYSTLYQVTLKVNTASGEFVISKAYSSITIAPATLSLAEHFGYGEMRINPNTDYLVFVEIYFENTFNPNDKYREETSNKVSFRYDSMELPPLPTKEGYTCTGWFLDAACTQSAVGHIILADTVLYAGWTINSYTVSFDTNGGADIDSRSVVYKTVLSNLPTPTRVGHAFKGWYIGETQYSNQEIKSDTELRAKWEAIMYTVTFMVDDEVHLTITVAYGTTITQAMIEAKLQSFNMSSVAFIDPTITPDSMKVMGDAVVDITEKTSTQQLSGALPAILGIGGGLIVVIMIGSVIGKFVKRSKRKVGR